MCEKSSKQHKLQRKWANKYTECGEPISRLRRHTFMRFIRRFLVFSRNFQVFFFQATFSTRDLPLRLIWYLAHGVITICCRTWSGSLQVVDWSQDRIFNQIATVKSLPPILQNDQWNKYNRNSNCRYYFSQLSPLWVTQQTTFTSLYELIWPLFKVI